jgi:hypothetical protein
MNKLGKIVRIRCVSFAIFITSLRSKNIIKNCQIKYVIYTVLQTFDRSQDIFTKYNIK